MSRPASNAFPVALALAILAVAALTIRPAAAFPAAQSGTSAWIDVLSVKVGTDGLIIIVCDRGEFRLADGTFENATGGQIVVRSGRLSSIRTRAGLTSNAVRATEDDGLYWKVEKGERPTPDGTYQLTGGTGRDRSKATAFRISSGRPTAILIGLLSRSSRE